MKGLVLLTAMCAATVCVVSPAFAADSKVSGKWVITGDVQGYPIAEHCSLAAGADEKLTGKCIGDKQKEVDATASFDGTTLTLKHAGEYNGQPLTLTFTGKLQTDGTLSGAIDVQPLNYDGSFTAKRDTEATAPAPAPKP